MHFLEQEPILSYAGFDCSRRILWSGPVGSPYILASFVRVRLTPDEDSTRGEDGILGVNNPETRYEVVEGWRRDLGERLTPPDVETGELGYEGPCRWHESAIFTTRSPSRNHRKAVHSLQSKDINNDHLELYFEAEVKQTNPRQTFPRAMEDYRKHRGLSRASRHGRKGLRDDAKLKGMKLLESYACEIRLLGIV